MLVQRRPTPAEAERQLRALIVRTSRLRLYHQRRAAGICTACEMPSPTSLCAECRDYQKLSTALRQGMAA